MVTPILSEADHERLAAAVVAAESRTTGEIVCVLTREVSTYPEIPVAAGALLALAPTPIFLALGVDPLELLRRWSGGWEAAHLTAADATLPVFTLFVALQLGLLVIGVALGSIPAVRRLLTPPALKRARVKAAATQQFLATGLAANAYRTGVVIFTSMHDRQVEVVADKAIHEACGDAAWQAAVKAVQAGMRGGDPAGGLVAAIGICGAALAQHFPSDGGGENTLVDRALEI